MTAKKLLPLLVFAVFAAAGGRADADWIRLKDGVQFHGQILRESSREITLRCDSGGILTFRTHQIESIHRVATTPKKPEDDKGRSGVQYDPEQLRAPEEVVVRRLDEVTVRLPAAFVQTKRRQKVADHTGELIGLFEDAQAQAAFSLSLGDYALGAANFDTMCRNLRQRFLWTEGFTLETWERRTIATHTALYAEMRRTRDSGSTVMVIQAWIEVDPGRVLTVSLEVPEEAFRASPQRYRTPVSSLAWSATPAEGSSPPTTAPRREP
ncbi:MAG: hypothetical protein AB7O52_14400 [Planctomycetota bacterium]